MLEYEPISVFGSLKSIEIEFPFYNQMHTLSDYAENGKCNQCRQVAPRRELKEKQNVFGILHGLIQSGLDSEIGNLVIVAACLLGLGVLFSCRIVILVVFTNGFNENAGWSAWRNVRVCSCYSVLDSAGL